MAKIFVTGGSGFIGEALIERIGLHDQNDYLLLSRKRHGSNEGQSRVRWLLGDLGGEKSWQGDVFDFMPEITIHLAWHGIPDFSAKTCVNNVRQSLDLYEFVAKLGCKTVISAGSCWEYGPAVGRVKENSPVFVASPFAAAKNSVLNLGSAIAYDNGQSFIWLRLFYVYGPRQKSSSLIPSIINSLKSGVKFNLTNPAIAQDFIYVEDAADAFIAASRRHWQPGSVILNVGSGKLTRVGDIADLLTCSKKIPDRLTNQGFYADLSNVHRELEWYPEVDITEGLVRIKQHLLSP